jgi:hypothetical protein
LFTFSANKINNPYAASVVVVVVVVDTACSTGRKCSSSKLRTHARCTGTSFGERARKMSAVVSIIGTARRGINEIARRGKKTWSWKAQKWLSAA